MDECCTLVVVLTAGSMLEWVECEFPGNILVPSKVGKLRLKKAAEILESDQSALLAICGGKRDNPRDSEATVANRWFCEQFPHLAQRIIITDAEAKFIASDMVSLARKIGWRLHDDPGLRIKVQVVTHPNHAALAITTLRAMLRPHALEMIGVASGEPAPYSPFIQGVLNQITKSDPGWIRPWWKSPTTALLRWKANQRSD